MPFGRSKAGKDIDHKTISKYRFRSLQKFVNNFYTIPLADITSELIVLESFSEWNFKEFAREGGEKVKWNLFFNVFEEKMASAVGFHQDDMWQGFLRVVFKYYPETAFNIALECDVRGRRIQDFVSRGLTKVDISLPCNFKHIEGSGMGRGALLGASASLSSRSKEIVEEIDEDDVDENGYDSIKRRSFTGSLQPSPEPARAAEEPFRTRCSTMQGMDSVPGPPVLPPAPLRPALVRQGSVNKGRPAPPPPPPPPGRVAPPSLSAMPESFEMIDNVDGSKSMLEGGRVLPTPPSSPHGLPMPGNSCFPEMRAPPEEIYAEVVKAKRYSMLQSPGGEGGGIGSQSQSSFTSTLLLPPGVSQMGGSPLPSPPPSPNSLRRDVSTSGREKVRLPNSPLPSPPLPRREVTPLPVPDAFEDGCRGSMPYLPPPPVDFMAGFYENFEDAQFIDHVDQVYLVSQRDLNEEGGGRSSTFFPPPPPEEELYQN